jgi:hypothetical protein
LIAARPAVPGSAARADAAVMARGRDGGEVRPDADLDLLVDQAFGVVWYRLLIGHEPLTIEVASRLAQGLARSAAPS